MFATEQVTWSCGLRADWRRATKQLISTLMMMMIKVTQIRAMSSSDAARIFLGSRSGNESQVVSVQCSNQRAAATGSATVCGLSAVAATNAPIDRLFLWPLQHKNREHTAFLLLLKDTMQLLSSFFFFL